MVVRYSPKPPYVRHRLYGGVRGSLCKGGSLLDYEKVTINISSAFDSWSSIKGCYRFFDNEKVESENILSEHVNATISRLVA